MNALKKRMVVETFANERTFQNELSSTNRKQKGAEMKILVVDDSQTMRRLIIRAIKKAGLGEHEFSEANNGLEGIEAVSRSEPEVIISDWNMPEMDGLEFLKKLRANGTDTRFGFITTEGTEDVKELATECGASFFVEKPFTPASLEVALGPFVGAQ